MSTVDETPVLSERERLAAEVALAQARLAALSDEVVVAEVTEVSEPEPIPAAATAAVETQAEPAKTPAAPTSQFATKGEDGVLRINVKGSRAFRHPIFTDEDGEVHHLTFNGGLNALEALLETTQGPPKTRAEEVAATAKLLSKVVSPETLQIISDLDGDTFNVVIERINEVLYGKPEENLGKAQA